MRPDRPLHRSIAPIALTLVLVSAIQGQGHGEVPAPAAKPAVETKHDAPRRPTHAPKPELPPPLAWQHVRAGNDAAVAALAAEQPLPAPATRPAGAGRYVCAAIVCADARVDVPALLGLAPRDVLLLSAPGPFVQAEAIALLEQAVAEERLSLVVVIGHADCRTLATQQGTSERQDALAARLAVVRREAARTGASLPQCLTRLQCQQMLAASDLLREQATNGSLRVLPAEVDARTGRVAWLHAPIDEYALPPIR